MTRGILWGLAALLLTGTPAGAQQADSRVEDRYKQILAANPVEGTALDRLWKLAESRGSTAALIEEYRQAAASGAMPASLIYGHLLNRAGRLDDAQAAYQQAAASDPASPLPPLALAALAEDRGKSAAAAEFLEAAVAKLPAGDKTRAAELLMKLGRDRLAAGDSAKAVDAWERTVALDPDNLDLRQQLAEAYEKNGLPERAIPHLEYVEQHGEASQRAKAAQALGKLHAVRGEFDAARAAFERGLALTAPGNWMRADLENQLIRLHQRAGRAGELEARWRAAAEQSPRDLGAWMELADLYTVLGEAEKERAVLEKICTLAPRRADFSISLARLLADEGQNGRAAEIYDRLLETQPGNLDWVFARAELDLRVGRTDAAVARVEAAHNRPPEDESKSAAVLEFLRGHHLSDAAERQLRAEAERPGAPDAAILSLADFYLADKKDPVAARAVIERFVASNSAARAARCQAAAELYKNHHALDDAARYARAAVDAAPDRAGWLALGDLEIARNDVASAKAAFTAAIDLSKGEAECEVPEQKLFQALESTRTTPIAPEMPGLVPPPAAFPPRPQVTAPSEASDPTREYLARLAVEARKHPSVDNLLRVARWNLWRRALPEATMAALQATAAAPGSIRAREMVIKLAMEEGDRAGAITGLESLAGIDPGHQAGYRRRIAQLKLDDNDTEGALAIFTELQKAAPGSREALTDLALAQQRADRWYDAAATWEQASHLQSLTPTQRADVRESLVLVLERLGQNDKVADLLQAAVAEEPDAGRRQTLFRELLAFCDKHGLTDRLVKTYDARLATGSHDYALLTEAADLRRSQGRERDAYALLEEAFYVAPDPVAALRSLVAEAESLGDLSGAIASQRRLIQLAGQNGAPEALEKLAALEEADLDTADAARTWEQAAGRFPRDPSVLALAEAFFEEVDQPERAREMLQKIVEIDPADASHRLRLGQLTAAAGDATAARREFEQVLARTGQAKPDDLLELPDLPAARLPVERVEEAPEAMETSPAPPPPPKPPATTVPKTDWQIRLLAIKEISQLLVQQAGHGNRAGDNAFTAWVDHYGAVDQPEDERPLVESLWALYYAGETGLALDLMERLLKEHPGDERLPRVFLAMAFDRGDFSRVARWSRADTGPEKNAIRGALVLDTLRHWLATVPGDLPADLVPSLFPPGCVPHERLWRAATQVFAPHNRFAEAVALGERAFAEPSTAQAGEGLQLARWYLILRHPGRAREVLRMAAEANSGVDGSSADEALREYYLLLPASERTPFRESFAALSQAEVAAGRRSPAQTRLSLALLDGLAGDWTASGGQLDRLLALRPVADGSTLGDPSVDARRWYYLLETGQQFISWHLDPLARHLWERAMGDPALLGLAEAARRRAASGEVRDQLVSPYEGTLCEVRNRWTALQLTESAADPARMESIVAGYLAATPPEWVPALGTALSGEGHPAAAATLAEALRHRDPAHPEHWRALLTAEAAAGDQRSLENTLRSLLTLFSTGSAGVHFAGEALITGEPSGGAVSAWDVALQLADCLRRAGDGGGEGRVLETALAAAPRDIPLLSRFASFRDRAGQPDEAARLYREILRLDPANAAALVDLHALLLRQGRPVIEMTTRLEDALRLGGAVALVSVGPVLAKDYLAAGDLDKLADLARRFAKEGDTAHASEIAAALAGKGPREKVMGRALQTAAIRQARNPQSEFAARQVFLENFCSFEDDRAFFDEQLKRLARLADGNPALELSFQDVRFALAVKNGATSRLEADLRREWRDGNASAGAQLVKLLVSAGRGKDLDDVVGQMCRRLQVDETSLQASVLQCDHAGRRDLCAALAARLCERFPQNETYVMEWACALWQSGRQREALDLLANVEAMSVFKDDVATRIAGLWTDLGEPDLAREVLARAVANDPGCGQPAAYLQLARLEMKRDQFAEVRRLLRAAYANLSCRDIAPLVEYLDARGQLDADGFAATQGWLVKELRPVLAEAMFKRLRDSGRADMAMRLVAANPPVLLDAPEIAATLRTDKTVDAAALGGLMETALSQAETPAPRLAHELAVLYDEGSARELIADPHSADARKQLFRACQLEPADFSRIRRMAALDAADRQPAAATAVIRLFLSSMDAPPSEKEEARQLLGSVQ